MVNSIETALYLFPVTLGDTSLERVLPQFNRDVVSGLRYFIVEDIRSARRFLRKVKNDFDIDASTFFELNQHTAPDEVAGFLKPLSDGHAMGVMSEAGCPAIADPGADVVALAQRKGFRVIPLVGPSSLLLALMASGFNGQNFAFNGYLPVTPAERAKKIRELERRAASEHQTQLFIETPYRNAKMMADLLAVCHPQTLLCIASGITCENETIVTRTVREWKKTPLPDLSKIPCIFLIHCI